MESKFYEISDMSEIECPYCERSVFPHNNGVGVRNMLEVVTCPYCKKLVRIETQVKCVVYVDW